MSWGAPTVIGSTQNKTANQASLAITLSDGAAQGDLVVLLVAKDNATTSEGDTTTDISVVTGPTDTSTWIKVLNWSNGTSLQGASVCCVWWSQVTVALAASDVITATFAGTTSSNDAQCGIVVKFSPSSGSLVNTSGSTGLSTDAADPADITLGSLTSREYLWLWALAGEGPDTDAYTIDSDYTAITGTGTTGGLAATNQHIRAAYRVMTGTTDTVSTSSDTEDVDYAQVLVVFREFTSGGGPAATQGYIIGG